MAIISHLHMCGWQSLQGLSDLERFQCVMKAIPDESLMAMLENDRGRGRNTYPVRAMWNSILVGIVFQHPSVETVQRALVRNGPCRALCKVSRHARSAWVFSHFFHRLLDHLDALDTFFDALVDQLRDLLPHFGDRLALDSRELPF